MPCMASCVPPMPCMVLLVDAGAVPVPGAVAVEISSVVTPPKILADAVATFAGIETPAAEIVAGAGSVVSRAPMRSSNTSSCCMPWRSLDAEAPVNSRAALIAFILD